MAELPTKEELEQLTPRAIVAYAARCARRLQQLYHHEDEKHVQAVDKAIRVAEEFARGGDAAQDSAAIAAAIAAVNAAEYTVNAATYAATNAVNAAYAAAAEAFAEAVAWAAKSSGNVTPRSDFNQLQALSTREHDSKFGDPIDLDALGPLWPDGEPDWYRKAVERRKVKSSELPPLTLYIDPGDAPAELITDYLLKLDELYQAIGGSGLRIVEDEIGTFVIEGAGA